MQANDITIKDAKDVDVVYTLAAPAAGYGGVAEWLRRSGAVASVFPRLTTSASLGKKQAGVQMRTGVVKFVMPSSYVDQNSGLTLIGPSAEVHVTVKQPDNYPESLKDDFAAQFGNLMNHQQIRDLVRNVTPST